MRVIHWCLLGMAAYLIAGCGAPTPESSSGDADPQTLSERLESTLNDVKSAAHQRVEEQADNVLAELDRRLDELSKEAANAAEAAARDSIESMRMELEEKRDAVQDKLAALRDDSGEARAGLQRDILDALADLRSVIEETAHLVEKPGAAPPAKRDGKP